MTNEQEEAEPQSSEKVFDYSFKSPGEPPKEVCPSEKSVHLMIVASTIGILQLWITMQETHHLHLNHRIILHTLEPEPATIWITYVII